MRPVVRQEGPRLKPEVHEHHLFIFGKNCPILARFEVPYGEGALTSQGWVVEIPGRTGPSVVLQPIAAEGSLKVLSPLELRELWDHLSESDRPEAAEAKAILRRSGALDDVLDQMENWSIVRGSNGVEIRRDGKPVPDALPIALPGAVWGWGEGWVDGWVVPWEGRNWILLPKEPGESSQARVVRQAERERLLAHLLTLAQSLDPRERSTRKLANRTLEQLMATGLLSPHKSA